MSDWPVHYKDSVKLIDSNSCVAVCCLWSPQKTVLKQLAGSQVNVIGNLYSVQGINYIARNILANPVIRDIVICGPDLTNTGKSLKSFLTLSERPQWLDEEITDLHAQLLRKNVRAHVIEGKLNHKIQDIQAMIRDNRGSWAEPIHIPTSEIKSSKLPSHVVVETVRESTFYRAWTEAIRLIMTHGNVSPTAYGNYQREVINLTAVVDEDIRDIDLDQFGIDPSKLEAYANTLVSSDHSDDVSYTYGSRFTEDLGVNQLEFMIADLKKNQASRRSIATTWNPQTDTKSKSPPCLISIHAMIRDGKLLLTCYLRSNDIYRAWPLNAIGLRWLQEDMARKLSVTSGPITIISGSAHIYDSCWPEAYELSCLKHPYRFDSDPRGSFLIEANATGITVQHFSLAGMKCSEFTVRRAADAKKRILPFISSVSHAMYLGRELERAQVALNEGKRYFNR